MTLGVLRYSFLCFPKVVFPYHFLIENVCTWQLFVILGENWKKKACRDAGGPEIQFSAVLEACRDAGGLEIQFSGFL